MILYLILLADVLVCLSKKLNFKGADTNNWSLSLQHRQQSTIRNGLFRQLRKGNLLVFGYGAIRRCEQEVCNGGEAATSSGVGAGCSGGRYPEP